MTGVTSDSPRGHYFNGGTWNPPNPLLLPEKMKVSFLTSAQAFALNFAVTFTLPFPAGFLPPSESRLFWKSVNCSEWYLKIKYNWFHSSLNLSYQKLIFSLFCFTHLKVIWVMTVETSKHKCSSSFLPFSLNLSEKRVCGGVSASACFVQMSFHIYSHLYLPMFVWVHQFALTVDVLLYFSVCVFVCITYAANMFIHACVFSKCSHPNAYVCL